MRKTTLIVLCAALTAMAPLGSSAYATDAVVGDFNGDSTVSLADLVLLARFTAQDTELSLGADAFATADFDGDGLIDTADLTLLSRRLAGLSNTDDDGITIVKSMIYNESWRGIPLDVDYAILYELPLSVTTGRMNVATAVDDLPGVTSKEYPKDWLHNESDFETSVVCYKNTIEASSQTEFTLTGTEVREDGIYIYFTRHIPEGADENRTYFMFDVSLDKNDYNGEDVYFLVTDEIPVETESETLICGSFMAEGGTDKSGEGVVTSRAEYEEIKSAFKLESDLPAKYDDAFFASNSLAFTAVPTYSLDNSVHASSARYADGTLEIVADEMPPDIRFADDGYRWVFVEVPNTLEITHVTAETRHVNMYQ